VQREGSAVAVLVVSPSSIIEGDAYGTLLVELTGDQLDRLNGMVREAINAAEEENQRELENLLSALHNIRWKAGDRRSD
jgi:hypothetical protein